MHIQSTNNVLISLSPSEIETIIDALDSDWHEWRIENAGVLLAQFKQLKERLSNQDTDVIDDSV